MHAGVPFDIDLLAANPIECRSGGAGNDYQIVLSGFPNPVTFLPGDVSISPGTGTVMSSSGSGTTTVTINLTGVTNAQKITVKIANLTDNAVPANTGTLGVTMGVLVGDTNGNGAVNAGDTTQTKGRSGQPTDATNFRSDVNTDGVINAGDSSAVKSALGHCVALAREREKTNHSKETPSADSDGAVCGRFVLSRDNAPIPAHWRLASSRPKPPPDNHVSVHARRLEADRRIGRVAQLRPLCASVVGRLSSSDTIAKRKLDPTAINNRAVISGRTGGQGSILRQPTSREEPGFDLPIALVIVIAAEEFKRR